MDQGATRIKMQRGSRCNEDQDASTEKSFIYISQNGFIFTKWHKIQLNFLFVKWSTSNRHAIYSLKTLPEAQRTLGIESITWVISAARNITTDDNFFSGNYFCWQDNFFSPDNFFSQDKLHWTKKGTQLHKKSPKGDSAGLSANSRNSTRTEVQWVYFQSKPWHIYGCHN